MNGIDHLLQFLVPLKPLKIKQFRKLSAHCCFPPLLKRARRNVFSYIYTHISGQVAVLFGIRGNLFFV
jgi:hypothetical protein